MRKLALALALFALAPAAADAAWREPRQVAHEDDVGAQFSSLSMAAAADGRALLVWATRGRNAQILAVDVQPDGSFGARRVLSARGAAVSAPQAAVGSGGEAVVAWRVGSPKRRQVQVVTRSAGGNFSPPRTITRGPGRAVLSSLGMADDGRALVAWARRSGRRVWGVEVAVRPAGGEFSAPVRLGRGLAADAHVAVAPDGGALVAWTERAREGAPTRIQHAVSMLPAAPARSGTLSGEGAFSPRPAVESGGAAIVGWLRPQGREHGIVEAARRAPGAGFAVPQRLQEGTAWAGELDVAVSGGHAFAAWSTSRRSRSEVKAAQAAPGAPFGGAQTLSDRGSAAWGPEVRAGGGRVVVIWADTPQDGPRNGLVGASHASFGSAFGAPVHVSEPNGILQTATQPRLAVTPSGAALAAYVNYGLDGESGSGQLALARLE